MHINSYITFQGLLEYDETLADSFSFPEGIEQEEVINEIIYATMELEVLVPSVERFKPIISHWCKARSYSWEQMLKALESIDNPLYNYYRDTWETTDYKGDGTTTGKSQNKATSYESNEARDTTSTDSSSVVDNKSNTDRHEISKGKIGWSKVQDIATAEITLRTKYDIYRIIAEEFKTRFCVMVY